MKQAEVRAAERTGDTEPGSLRRTEEFRSWFFLTFVMAPMLAVIIVSGFGFFVWMYQLIAGPPAA